MRIDGRVPAHTQGPRITSESKSCRSCDSELNASEQPTAAYAYGAAGLFDHYDGTGYTCYAFDPAGNLVERLRGADPNAGQTDYVEDTAVYDTYGQLWADVDGDTGLILMGSRHYAPAMRRFISRPAMLCPTVVVQRKPCGCPATPARQLYGHNPTPQHPFYVASQWFVQAGELGIGTQIVTRAGLVLFLKTVSRPESGESLPE
jgi:hypothetical protein